VKIYYYEICSPLILRWCWSKITSKNKNKTINIQLLVTEADSEMPKKIHDKSSKSSHTIEHTINMREIEVKKLNNES